MVRFILIGAIAGSGYYLSQNVLGGEAATIVSLVPLSAAIAVFALWS